MQPYILVVNPGSTTTKIALYYGVQACFTETIEHKRRELAAFPNTASQLAYRTELIKRLVKEKGWMLNQISVVIGRGGMVPGIKTGGYLVEKELAECLLSDKIPQHASNLGGAIAFALAGEIGVNAYIYDGVTSSELPGIAKITGFAQVERGSVCHVLNSKAMAREYARLKGNEYKNINVIVVHMGGGITVSAHEKGKIVDTIGDDECHFSPERAGAIPLLSFLDICFSGDYTKEELRSMIRGKGGLYALLGTSDGREVTDMIMEGNQNARLVYEALAYQVSKSIGQLATVLKGKIDAIIITGGLANSRMLTDMIKERTAFLGTVEIIPGEKEMEALAMGACRIFAGEEKARTWEI